MIGPTNARGGGGLNLKVVGGTTQPANPQENTIWVNTTTGITGYVLSPTRPENGTDGLVWLKTADTGVEINVGRKNAVLLHLASGMLHSGGKWLNINAFVYANNVWTQFAQEGLMIFNREEEEYDAIIAKLKNSSEEGQYLKKSDVNPYIRFSLWYGSKIERGYYCIAPVDVTNFSVLEVVGYSNTDKMTAFGLSTAAGTKLDAAKQTFTTDESVNKVDISNLTGEFYIGFSLKRVNDSTSAEIFVKSVYLR